MTNIFLKDAKVYLVNINLETELERSYQRPSVIVHADLSKLDIDQLSASLIEVPKMSSTNPSNPMVDVSFYYKKNHIKFRMPMQFYAVSFSLSKLAMYDMGGVGIYLVDSRKYPTINPATVLPYESIEFNLMFDPKKELQYSEALRGNIHPSMTSSLSHLPWIGIGVNGPSPMDFVNKTVLGKALRLSLAFANGRIPMNLFYIEDDKDLIVHSDEKMIIPDSDRYFQLDNIMERVKLSSPKYQSAYAEKPSDEENVDDESEESDSSEKFLTNIMFNELISDFDLDSSVTQLIQDEASTDSKLNSWEQNTLLWDANASESWNPIMISIYERCRDEGVLQEIESIINMLIVGDYYQLIGRFDHELVEIASALYFAMQAHKLSSYTGTKVNDIIIEWFSETDDFKDNWMLEEMGEELFYLDNYNVSTLLKYKNGHKGFFAPAMMNLAIFVGHLLDNSSMFDDDAERKDVISEISKYDFTHPSHKIVKDILTGYMTNIESNEQEFFDARESGIDLPYHALLNKALNTMVMGNGSQDEHVDYHSDEFIGYWAEGFSLAIPFLAEMVATRTEEKGSEEWNELKQSFMASLLAELTREFS